MMKKFIKNCFYKGAKTTGIYTIIKKLKTGALALCYHGIENKIIDSQIQGIHLTFSEFEKQIKYLRNNFEIISLDYFYDCLANGYKIDPSQVLITFDDGYKNNIKIVAPFLKSYNIPFSVFISTNHINKGFRFPTYFLRASVYYSEHKYIYLPSIKREFDIGNQEKRIDVKNIIEVYLKTSPQHIVNLIVMDLISLIPHDRWLELNDFFSSDEPMNWDDVKKLHNLGVTIGSHCHNHFILHSYQSKAEINYQLKTSKDLIEKNLGECKYIAYPNGEMDNITIDTLASVKEAEYLLGFTSVRGEIKNSVNPYILPRLGAPANLDHFKFIANTALRYNKKFINWSSNFDKSLK